MSVPSNQANRYAYAADGSTVTFAYNSVFENAADLLVYTWDKVNLTSLVKILNSDYTVTGGSGAAGAVVFGVAPANTFDVIIIGDPAIVQALTVVPDGAFPAATFTYGIDYLTLLVSRMNDLASRCVALSDWDISGFYPALPFPRSAGDMLCVNGGNTGWGDFPTAVQRANQYLGFDSNGLPIAVTPTILPAAATALGQLTLQQTVVSITFADSPYTAQLYHRVINVNTAGGNVVVNLPAKTGTAGAVIEVVKTTSDANTVTVTPNGTDNFLGANASQVLSNQWSSLRALLLGALGWIN